jgi:hypothetical protein
MSTLQTVKISELIAATSVSASDDLPIVQSGVTKKADASLLQFDINALPTASVLNPTDLVPILQSGVERKVEASLFSSGGGRPYKVYSALLNFNGGSPLATVLENTIGDGSGNGTTDIAWSFPLINGFVRATMSSGAPFPSSKTWIASGCRLESGELYFVSGQRFSLSPNNVIDIILTKFDNTRTGTPNFVNLPIEIRVYN